MTGWLVLAAVYLAGWALEVPWALRRRMLARICVYCHHGGTRAGHSGHRKRHPTAVRGSLRDRNGRDAAAALVAAAFWPYHRCRAMGVRAAKTTAAVVTRVVLRTTPLTGPELDRRITEQQADIDRLSAQVKDDWEQAKPPTPAVYRAATPPAMIVYQYRGRCDHGHV